MLARPGYGRLFAAQTISRWGDTVSTVALVVLVYRLTGSGFEALLGAIGAGAALGPLLLARLASNPRRPALVFGPYLLRGLVDLVLAITRNLPAALAALACYGVGTSTGMVTYNSLLQAHVRDQMRGRVFAAYDMIWQTGRLAYLALGGLAADALGIQAVYLLGGLLLLAAGSVGLAGLRPAKDHHPAGEPPQ